MTSSRESPGEHQRERESLQRIARETPENLQRTSKEPPANRHSSRTTTRSTANRLSRSKANSINRIAGRPPADTSLASLRRTPSQSTAPTAFGRASLAPVSYLLPVDRLSTFPSRRASGLPGRSSSRRSSRANAAPCANRAQHKLRAETRWKRSPNAAGRTGLWPRRADRPDAGPPFLGWSLVRASRGSPSGRRPYLIWPVDRNAAGRALARSANSGPDSARSPGLASVCTGCGRTCRRTSSAGASGQGRPGQSRSPVVTEVPESERRDRGSPAQCEQHRALNWLCQSGGINRTGKALPAREAGSCPFEWIRFRGGLPPGSLGALRPGQRNVRRSPIWRKVSWLVFGFRRLLRLH